jgi:hypothetical protein
MWSQLWIFLVRPYHISSSKKNESHDLRLLDTVKTGINTTFSIIGKPSSKTFIETNKILNKMVYGVGIKKEYKTFGTLENLSLSESKIYNVNGVYNALKKAVRMPYVSVENQLIYNNDANLLGNLHIYDDGSGRPIKYERL